MPHKVLALVLKHINIVPTDTDQEQATVNTWQLVMRWCVMAAQKDQQGDSFVLFSIEAILEGDDAYFGQWMENHLDSTMGTRPVTEPCTGAPGVVTTPQVPAHFAAELGKGVALAFTPTVHSRHQPCTRVGSRTLMASRGMERRTLRCLWVFCTSRKGTNSKTSGRIFSPRGVKISTSAGSNSWIE